ncbi:MAG: PKD domain-containing protein [Bacteroidetes bacterium]|nr:MAG: PKD domain-containing protein [Bacteroidota bacterium]
MMKRLSFLSILLLAFWAHLPAQTTLSFLGQVQDAPSTQTPVPFHPVWVEVYSGGFIVHVDSFLTDAAGQFIDSTMLAPGTSQGLVVVSTPTCLGGLATDTLFFNPGNTNFSNLILYACDSTNNPVSCQASFVTVPLGASFGFFSLSTPSTGGVILTTSWDFGNGVTATGDSAFVTYAQPGTYNVCLTITDGMGCSDTQCQSVVVQNPGGLCYVGFFGTDLGQQTVSFTNLSSPGSYLWDFGDGTTSTQVNPTHTFPADSIFNVCLTVTDTSATGFCSDSLCMVVQVGTPASICNAAFSYFPNDPLNPYEIAFFSDSLSNFNVSHFWDYGDGNTSTSANPVQVHTYNGVGPYYVCHTVTDSLGGCTDTFCDTVYLIAPPNCQAIFGFDTLGLTADFTDFSVYDSTNGGASYLWDFGDGNTSTSVDPSHTYGAAGVYVVCLTIIAPDGCTATGCQLVTVGGSASNCVADFSTSPAGPTTMVFTAQQPIFAPWSYTWDLGDGTVTSGAPLYVHTYAQPGTYLVCLTVSDTASGCSATFCDTVQVGGGTFCQADFVYNLSASGQASFTNLSLPADPWVSFQWDFGDSTYSTAVNPTHTYNGQGPWTVCLTLLDSMTGCSSTTCQLIGTPSAGLTIQGLVLADSIPVFNGMAYLIQHDSLAGTLTAVDSTYILAGHYAFGFVSPGTYLVKAALTPASPVYANYLPTYFGDELFWDDATSIVATNASQFLPPISLVAGTNPGGPGFIGGLVSQGANKTEGDPLMNMSILLLDIHEQPITHVTTDGAGEFSFPNLAYGTYKVYVEMAGMYSTPWIVTISPDNPTVTDINFEMNETGINPTGTTSIDKELGIEGLMVYPNPVQDMVQVALNLRQSGTVSLMLRNPLGQLVRQQAEAVAPGSRQLTLPMADLPAGTYLLQVVTPEGVESRRLIKR